MRDERVSTRELLKNNAGGWTAGFETFPDHDLATGRLQKKPSC
jgi:hypothetical protein